MTGDHPLPAVLEALVSATAERLRQGRTRPATVSLMAAECEHAGQWAIDQIGSPHVIAMDLLETGRRLAVLAGTDDPERAS